jgi:P27 family predicted phage terminase small subunit
MGRRGRTAQPTALKLARGNPGKRALNHAEPELAPPSSNAPPRGLAGRAKKEWTRLVDELISKGVLTVGDMHAFEQYCRLVGEIDEYEALIADVGRAAAHSQGFANYLLKLRSQLRQQAAHIGLTPSSRSGVKAVKVAKPGDAKRKRFFGSAPSEP